MIDTAQFPAFAKKYFGLILIALTIVSAAARLPQVFGGNFLADGDECLLGLQAKHMMEGKSFSLLFPGQRYGFAIVESGAVALSFLAFGISSLSLKAPMLLLWLIGANVFARAVRRFSGEGVALLAAAILFCAPAWMVWSLKAWGGYITAFLCSSVFLLMVSGEARRSDTHVLTRTGFVRFVALGGIMGLTFISQAFFFVPTLLFAPLALRRPFLFKKSLLIVSGAALVIGASYLYSLHSPPGYYTPQIFTPKAGFSEVREIPQGLAAVLGGNYSWETVVDFGPWAAAYGLAAAIFTALVIGIVGVRFLRKRTYDHATAAALGILAALAISIWVDRAYYGFRYLLAIPALSALLLAVEARRGFVRSKGMRAIVGIVVGAVLLAGGSAAFGFRDMSYYGRVVDNRVSETAMMKDLLSALESRGVRFVFCTHPMLEFNIAFESRERIICRWRDDRDRFQDYVDRVNAAYAEGRPVALVGYYQQKDSVLFWLVNRPELLKNFQIISRRYFILVGPPVWLLKNLLYRLPNWGT
jgi:hypothetical protein